MEMVQNVHLTRNIRILSIALRVAFVILLLQQLPCANGEVLRKAETMEQLLKAADISELANETRQRGDARRGAIIFWLFRRMCGYFNFESTSRFRLHIAGPASAEVNSEPGFF